MKGRLFSEQYFAKLYAKDRQGTASVLCRGLLAQKLHSLI